MFDPILLRTFLVVARGNSFSATSEKLAVSQSTVSDHIRRLERHVGRQLFVRDTHSIRLTPDGEALIGYARSIEDTTARALRFFADAKPRRRVRFGVSEDLVATILPEVLARFTSAHPDVDLELTTALSTKLVAGFDAGDLDLALCKRWPDEERGDLVCRDDLVWIGPPGLDCGRFARGEQPWPLILYRPPSITRSVVIDGLARAQIAWRLACTSDSLDGLITATRSGLGVTVLARKLIPPGLRDIGAAGALPALGHIDFVLLRHHSRSSSPIADIVASILARYETGGADAG